MLAWLCSASCVLSSASSAGPTPVFDRNDKSRPRIAIDLVEFVSGIIQPTDIQFVPGDPGLVVILEKTGKARWFDSRRGSKGTLLELDVLTRSEQGLLGLAFHPLFPKNGRLFLNRTVASGTVEVTRVDEWSVEPESDLRRVRPVLRRVLLEVVQPYENHNAGQLAFGPDGYLYVGFGDGGAGNDPHGHGQNPATFLGKMLRIDVDRSEGTRPYRVPPDNPFVDREGHLPEIWAVGLRNPWRYGFDPQGRLIVADVGQDRFEELDILGKGSNGGWNVREGKHCFRPREGCRGIGFVEPIFEYGREDGGSITGGFVALGGHVPALSGKYVFGDFLSGRLWAIDLPPSGGGSAPPPVVHALGRWPILPSTFGRDASGRLYVADYPGGIVYRIDPSTRR